MRVVLPGAFPFALAAGAVWAATGASPAVKPPAPYGPVPTPRQIAWQDTEVYGLVHFSTNTFCDKEWGYGDEPASCFNPTHFDARQIVRAARDGGLKGLVIVAKHHCGFCLWPSKYTDYSVKSSPWEGGKGDMVRDFADACHEYGLKFGFYLSPWDRNRADYGRPSYVVYYRNQLRELLTGYGPVFMVWFDGANGGDGYYGGARETRHIPPGYYQWDKVYNLVRKLQPGACMFGGPDVRWVGNENGIAGDPCWETMGPKGDVNHGARPGNVWQPAECDVPMRPGWFWHASQDTQVKTPSQLVDLYYKSVGRGACLDLGLAPNREGLLAEPDVKALHGFRHILYATFSHDFARGAEASASNVRGGSAAYDAAKVCDGDRDTYWATDDGVTTADLVLKLPQPVTFDVVRVREYIQLGQRVDAFALDAWVDGAWKEFASATSIGAQRLLRVPAQTTDRVRLRITKAEACPCISELGLFRQPANH